MGTAAAARGVCRYWEKFWNGNPCSGCAWFPDWLSPPEFPWTPSAPLPRGEVPGLLDCRQPKKESKT